MNAVLVVVSVLLVVLALVVGGTGLLALTGRLPGNDVLGVRTPETRRSPEAWELANRAAGPAFLGSGLVLLLGTLAQGLIGGWIGGVVVVVAVAIALALLNVAGIAGARAAAIWQAEQGDEDGCGAGRAAAAATPARPMPATARPPRPTARHATPPAAPPAPPTTAA